MTRFQYLLRAALTLAVPAAVSAQAPVAVTAGRMLDLRTGRMIEHPVIVIQGDKILSVGTSAPAGVTPTDLGDGSLLPGILAAVRSRRSVPPPSTRQTCWGGRSG